VEELQVPPLVLQPLVENAVLHGISAREEGVVVHVAARLRPPMLALSVWDDGPRGGASRHEGTGTSLRDLRRRLEIIYGAAAWLHTRNETGGGFCAEIGIPFGPASCSKGQSA
jgi:LytS/YehU family sensor histidine kinase